MTLAVSNHAVERYVERYKPQLGQAQARRELEALVLLAEGPLSEKPHWLGDGRDADEWIELAENLVGAVREGVITTIFARSGLSRAHRARRQERKKKRRSQREWQNRLGRPGGHTKGPVIEWA